MIKEFPVTVEVKVSPEVKRKVVSYGRKWIFKTSSTHPLDNEKEQAFDKAWNEGLESHLLAAIVNKLQIDAHVAREQLENKSPRSLSYFNTSLKHYQFHYNNLLWVAQLRPLSISKDIFELDQLWGFTFNVMPNITRRDLIFSRWDRSAEKPSMHNVQTVHISHAYGIIYLTGVRSR
jgi:hypothetical protein